MTNESVFESIEKCPYYTKKKDFINKNRSQCAEGEYKPSIDGSDGYFQLYLLQM